MSLNLNKLEQKLDNALNKETKFSLIVWLFKKRIKQKFNKLWN